ncbi:7161_t:CDS:2 [Acaulospora colombiana]|uniref:7161_t:CDS:1 n=1 Tax=Acaulospora colombiana TaxID=27376 RepID=A0ACA9MH64_9GLOM|nr:7161_t:CDS:2 [Acaulospora colombiana]
MSGAVQDKLSPNHIFRFLMPDMKIKPSFLKSILLKRKKKKQSKASSAASSASNLTTPMCETPIVASEAPTDTVEISPAPSVAVEEASETASTKVSEESEGEKLQKKLNENHQKLLKWLDPIITVVQLGKEAGEAHSTVAPLKAACGITLVALNSVRSTLEHHYTFLETEQKKVEKASDSDFGNIDDPTFKKALETYVDEAHRLYGAKPKTWVKQAGKAQSEAETIQDLTDELNRGWELLRARVLFSVRDVLNRAESHIIQMSEGVMEGTRVQLLAQISTWADDADSPQIFWLCDQPGSGKSTVAAHMANVWKKDRLAARFFFCPDQQETRRVDRFVATIAKQIYGSHRRSAQYLVTALDKVRDLSGPSFADAFKVLVSDLVEFLSKAPAGVSGASESSNVQMPPLLLVIDSIDQCEEWDRRWLLDALTHYLPSKSALKVLVTSTSLPDIKKAFDDPTLVHLCQDVLTFPPSDGQDDIAFYIRNRLNKLRREDHDLVVKYAHNLFQRAFVACTHLEKTFNTPAILAKLGAMDKDDSFRPMYQATIEAALPDEDSLIAMKQVLQGIALPYRPVSPAVIESFFRPPEEAGYVPDYVSRLLTSLRSVVFHSPKELYRPIHILHPTFTEFLKTIDRDEKFSIIPWAGHANIARVCIELLQSLPSNPPNPPSLRPSSTFEPLLPSSLPPSVASVLNDNRHATLRYGIAFWTRHAAEGLLDDELRLQLVPLFQSKTLDWIYHAAQLRELSECIEGMQLLKKKLETQQRLSYAPEALSWSNDIIEFLQDHMKMLEECPSETYRSALLFLSPTSSIFRTYRATLLRYLPTQLYDDRVLNSSLQSPLTSLQFSPNGRFVVSVSSDGQGHLWDAHNSALIQKLGHHENTAISCMAWSNNSRLLAMGSSEGNVYVWELSVHGPLNNRPMVLEADSIVIKCLAFSASRSLLVCGGEDGSLVLWKLENQRWTMQLHWGTGSAIKTLSLTHTGDRLVCLDESGFLRLYNLENLDTLTEVVLTSRGRSDGPSYLSFSTDGRTLAVYVDGTLSVLDVLNDMKQFMSLQGHACSPYFATRNGLEYLYWDRWILDFNRISRDDLVQEENGIDYLVTASSDPIRVPLVYLEENMTTVRAYRAEDPLMAVPSSWRVRCWAAFQQRIAFGLENGQVAIMDVEQDELDGASIYSTASEGAV